MSPSFSGSPCPTFHGTYRTSDPPNLLKPFFQCPYLHHHLTAITNHTLTTHWSAPKESSVASQPTEGLHHACQRRVHHDLFAELCAKHHSTLPLTKCIMDLPSVLPSFPPIKQHRSALEEPSDDVLDVIDSPLRFHVYVYADRGPFNHAITLQVYIGERSSAVLESLRIALPSSTNVPTATYQASSRSPSNQLVSRNTSPSLPQASQRNLSSA